MKARFILTFWLLGCASPPSNKPKSEPVVSAPRLGGPCAGESNSECGDGAFCEHTTQEFTVEDDNCSEGNQGVRAIPRSCPDNYVPVCGCDSVTYSNSCEADLAGVAIRSGGHCPGPRTVFRKVIRGICQPRPDSKP